MASLFLRRSKSKVIEAVLADLAEIKRRRRHAQDRAEEAIERITEQLEWRGPSGKVMGHIVLPRDLAEALHRMLRR